jgi:hypothetical protein
MILTADEWLDLDFTADENDIIIGSPENAIIRPHTKNLIQGSEKTFKTTFMLRLMLSLSCGVTAFECLPVLKPREVLYIHGELSEPEIKERTSGAADGLKRPLNNFRQGRSIHIDFRKTLGRAALRSILESHKPEDLVLDPWQSFIPGADENTFKDVSEATHFLDGLIEEFGVTIYLVVHTGKDASRGARGHSSLAGWRDTLIKLERNGNTPNVKITVDPRYAPPMPAFTVKFDKGTLRAAETTGFSLGTNRICRVLREHGGTATKQIISAELKLNPEALRKAMQRGKDAGAFKVTGDQVALSAKDAEHKDAGVLP